MYSFRNCVPVSETHGFPSLGVSNLCPLGIVTDGNVCFSASSPHIYEQETKVGYSAPGTICVASSVKKLFRRGVGGTEMCQISLARTQGLPLLQEGELPWTFSNISIDHPISRLLRWVSTETTRPQDASNQ
ncbi:hypothetical protein DPEC_G00155340 [Dallia pectoralis]|uniref:Uncharacterized protein n=1 Tax=Dallia pectoralis TaxID=75939 RepID=A0ACC2GKN1_DALPE|nr:hypothetical protein DPEC_G00155340 [Dallia pectoralis]